MLAELHKKYDDKVYGDFVDLIASKTDLSEETQKVLTEIVEELSGDMGVNNRRLKLNQEYAAEENEIYHSGKAYAYRHVIRTINMILYTNYYHD